MVDSVPSKPRSPAQHSATTPQIVEGTIVDVNPETHTCTVHVENLQGSRPDVQIASLYVHPDGGHGSSHLPEPGATCKLCIPSDGSRAFVLCYVMSPTRVPGDTGGRAPMLPGEFHWTTRDGNFMRLRRGGIVEIGAHALAQRMYVPLANVIRDFCGQYEMLSLLGNVSWTHDDPGLGPTKVRYEAHVRENVEDVEHRLDVEVSEGTDLMPEGYADAAFPPGLSYLRVKVSDDTFTSRTWVFQLSKAGDVFAHADGRTLVESDGRLRLHAHAELELRGPAGYQNDVDQAGKRTEALTALEVQALTRIVEKAPEIVLDAALTKLGGDGATFAVFRAEALLGWLRALTINPLTLRPAVELPPDVFLTSPNVKVT